MILFNSGSYAGPTHTFISIDHCTMITEETAGLIKQAEGRAYAVPTLAVLEQILQHGKELGMYEESMAKPDKNFSMIMKGGEFVRSIS